MATLTLHRSFALLLAAALATLGTPLPDAAAAQPGTRPEANALATASRAEFKQAVLDGLAAARKTATGKTVTFKFEIDMEQALRKQITGFRNANGSLETTITVFDKETARFKCTADRECWSSIDRGKTWTKAATNAVTVTRLTPTRLTGKTLPEEAAYTTSPGNATMRNVTNPLSATEWHLTEAKVSFTPDGLSSFTADQTITTTVTTRVTQTLSAPRPVTKPTPAELGGRPTSERIALQLVNHS